MKYSANTLEHHWMPFTPNREFKENPRFVVKSKGYAATIVAGQVVVENGEHTGNRPGQVIREFVRG